MPLDSKDASGLESVRLDVWLDVACVFPTRSQAKAACEGGKVDLNGSRAKAHREIRPGDRLTITRAENSAASSSSRPRRALDPEGGGPQALRGRHASSPPEMLEARRLDRLLAPSADPRAAPTGAREENAASERAGDLFWLSTVDCRL